MRTQFARPGSVLWIITFPFYIFRTIGLAPFSIKKEKSLKNSLVVQTTRVFEHSKLGSVYNVAITFFYVGMFVTSFSRNVFGTVYPFNSAISLIAESVQAVIGISVVCTLTLFWALRQRFAAGVVNKILVVDDLLFTLNCASFATRNVIHLLIHTLLIIVAFIGLILTDVFAFHGNFVTMFKLNVPIFVIDCFIVQYAGVLYLVSSKLEVSNRKLLSLGNIDSTQVPLIVTRYPEAHNCTISLLRDLRNIHTSLCEISRDLSEFYSFAILLVVTYHFVSLVYAAYYLIIPIIESEGNMSASLVGNMTLWLVILIYPLNMMLWSTTRVVEEVKRTGEVINKLLDIAMRQDIKAEILGAVTVYLVILVQFHMVNARAIEACNAT